MHSEPLFFLLMNECFSLYRCVNDPDLKQWEKERSDKDNAEASIQNIVVGKQCGHFDVLSKEIIMQTIASVKRQNEVWGKYNIACVSIATFSQTVQGEYCQMSMVQV